MKYFLIIFSVCFTSFCLAQQQYYNDVNLNLTGINLKNELATKIISTHTNFLSYAEAYQVIKDTDEDSANNSNVILFYNNQSEPKTNTIGGGNTTNPEVWNREHVFAQSFGTPNIGTSGPGSDVHNLRACDAAVNNNRASREFTNGTGLTGSTVGAYYYPGDNWKGDVARIIMYMYLRYGTQCLPSNAGIGSSTSTPDDMIDLFLTWNSEDPVSPIEAQRNTILQTEQGNRNPFIDNPYLATIIWGGAAAEDIWGIYTTTDTQDPTIPTNLIASNPTSGSIQLNWTASTDNNTVVSYDIFQDGINTYNSTSTNFVVNGLNASTNYCFTVLAIDQAGNTSAQSIQDCETTLMPGASGTACVIEDFANVPSGQTNYTTRTWQDINNQTWQATDARTDQDVTNQAITIRNGQLTSPTINGGIGDLTVTTKRVFTGTSGIFNVLVNGSSVGSIPYGNQDEIITTTISNINIQGNISLIIENTSTTNRVAVDDLNWTCYSTLNTDNFSFSNRFKIYPNPLQTNQLSIDSKENTLVEIYSILGEKVFDSNLITGINLLNLKELNTGIYLIKLKSNYGTITKKLIKK